MVGSLLLLCCLLGGSGLAQVRHPLPLLWLMPVSSSDGENLTASVAPAVQLALQDLKRQPPPLGNYEIQFQLLDSQCDVSSRLRALFDAMWAGPRYPLVFGGGCPSVTALIARALPSLNLVQVSFAASSPSLSNRKWYGNLFSTVPSDRAVNQATVKLLQRFKWTRVGVIIQEGPRLSEMKKDLTRQLLKSNVQVVSMESLSDGVCSSLRRLKEHDVRIIIGLFSEDSASLVFCCAHRLNLFGHRYQWILTAGGTAEWGPGMQVSGCTSSSLLMAAEGSITLQIRRLSNSSTAGVSGRTPQDYQDTYFKQLTREGFKFSPLHSFAYDAVWVAAKALSQVMEAVKRRERYSVNRSVSVTEEEVEKTLLEAVRQTHFEGVTGPVFFRHGERMTSIELVQFQAGVGVLVGEFSTNTQQLRVVNNRLKFKGSGPAKDQTQFQLKRLHIDLHLFFIMSSVTAVTIVISLMVLCFTVIRRWLTGSRGSQDELLLLGIVLSSSWVLIAGLDGAFLWEHTVEPLCSVRLWILSLGQTLTFSALFAKTWRVYSHCIVNQKHQPPVGCVVPCLSLLDVLVLTSWQILDPIRRVVMQHSSESDPADHSLVIQTYWEHCSSINMEWWLTAVYAYKGALLGLGCFLAWNVRTAADGKYLSLSMFAVTTSSMLGVSGSLLVSHNPAVHFCLIGTLILGCNILILCWLFGAKLLPSMRLNSQEQHSEAAEEEEVGDELNRLNEQLKFRTTQLEAEIQTIIAQLRDPPGMTQHSTLHADEPVTHRAHVCTLDNINSPELVRRRLSVQLPILHHSYLPAIGGVSASTSSLYGSQEAFVYHNSPMNTSCPPHQTLLEMNH